VTTLIVKDRVLGHNPIMALCARATRKLSSAHAFGVSSMYDSLKLSVNHAWLKKVIEGV
jgi:hypothetical protein